MTFDSHQDCPKCGRSLPPSLVTVSAAPLRKRLRGGTSYLSPLSTGSVPRFFSADADSEVVSLLGEATRLISKSSKEFPPKRTDQSPEPRSNGSSPRREESDPDSFVPGVVLKEDSGSTGEDLPEPEKLASVEAEGDLPVVQDPEVAQAEVEAAFPEASDETDSTDLVDATGDLDETEAEPETVGMDGQGDGEEVSAEDLWAEAFAEQEAAEGKPSKKEPDVPVSDMTTGTVAAEEVSVPDSKEMTGEVSSEEGGADTNITSEENDIESMWADAFAEQEAAEASALEGSDKSLPGDSEERSAVAPETSDDDIGNLWDEAFSEQAAAEQEAELQGEDSPESEDGGFSDFDENGIEKMWEEALSESFQSETELEGGTLSEEASERGNENPSAPAEIVSQEDLDALLSGVSEESGDSPPKGRGAQEPPNEVAALEIDEDEEEIDAFVVDDDGDSEDDENEGVAVSGHRDDTAGAAERGGVALQKRLAAGLTDAGVIFLVQALFMSGTHLIIGQVVGSIFGNMEALVLTLALDLVVLFLLTFLYSVYFVGGWGQTPGQRLTGLNVVDLNNQPVGYMQAVLRYFGTLAAVLPVGLGLLLPMLDDQGRGLGDRLAGTKAVYRGSI